ncbi:endonuclease V [Sporosarcina sp. CAU 1771]
MRLFAGEDVAYWQHAGSEWGVCSIIVIDCLTKKATEKVYSVGRVYEPYVPGYLAFRELPLFINAAKKLVCLPDLFMFDGNGYLHPRNMGIATHAAFFLNKPTIGVAKKYFHMDKASFTIPENKVGSYTDILLNETIVGRVLRSRKNVKPIYISFGNYIDLESMTNITLSLLSGESRVPIPVRLADIETRRLRNHFIQTNFPK